jgi:hypothetical protein
VLLMGRNSNYPGRRRKSYFVEVKVPIPAGTSAAHLPAVVKIDPSANLDSILTTRKNTKYSHRSEKSHANHVPQELTVRDPLLSNVFAALAINSPKSCAPVKAAAPPATGEKS